ncbi:hypothetical protein [Coprococcus sp. B2-R-112]|uniref:hypothetical protein n=1 Tax=Coprococcus sp. B2-R-112 TaxID=2949662 RepID=UPI00202F4023|nr:hypothetical protein [Coprococcus sp. B2-R-112]MCM0662352.1 hypothetical protein [Coprococcus sp. B2-R-112]
MDKDLKMIYDEEAGGLKEYQEPYVTIDCATEDDFLFIEKAVGFYKKMQWIPAENPPEVDEEGYSKYILLNFANAPICEIGKYIEDGDGGGAYYVGDDEKSCLRYGLFVDAWMPLPERYKGE